MSRLYGAGDQDQGSVYARQVLLSVVFLFVRMFVCLSVSLCVCVQVEQTSLYAWVSLFSPYSLKAGSLSETSTRLTNSKPQPLSCHS